MPKGSASAGSPATLASAAFGANASSCAMCASGSDPERSSVPTGGGAEERTGVKTASAELKILWARLVRRAICREAAKSASVGVACPSTAMAPARDGT